MNNYNEILKKAINLSKLSDNEIEKNEIKEGFKKIFDWIESLSKIETGDTEPLIHLFAKKYIPREDFPKESLPHSDVLGNAPQKNSNYIVVPQIK